MIVRDSTKEELMDFTPLMNRTGNTKNPADKFINKINEEEAKANKKGLPFATLAATNDFKEDIENQLKRLKNLYGYKKVDELKSPEIDWNKYSDLNNFDLIEEGEVFDEHLSKRHLVDVFVKKKTYQYKGYGNKYIVMESPNKAVQRAKGLLDKPSKKE
jgi:hypothetical protein